MNTFGTAKLKFGLCDPRDVRINRDRFRRDAIPYLDKANSFYCPLGKWASRGWILLPRYEYVQLNNFASNFQLQLDSTVLLQNLNIIHAQCATRGIASDPNALYLIELTDARGVVYNKWFQFPTNSQYNIRAPGYPGQYYSLSLNSGTPWTWSTMIGDLWNQMNSFLGTYPGLPIVVTGTPENWSFIGVSAWEALCEVLGHLGLIVACDLTKTSPFTIVYNALVDANLARLETLYKPNLEDDFEWLDSGNARIPGSVVVYFKYRNEYYGTEETVRADSLQWISNQLYSVTVAAPAILAGGSGVDFLHDDFTIRRDINGVANTADTALAATIAAERTTQYFADIYGSIPEYMTQIYTGALPFYTGSQVDGVCWSQDYSNQDRQGWKTTIVRGYQPPWPELWDNP